MLHYWCHFRRKMFVAKGYGKLEVSVGLAKDPKFHVQVYPADNVDVSNRLFVGLTLASDNSNLKLIVDSCLASPTSPPNRYQEHLIKDGCVNSFSFHFSQYWMFMSCLLIIPVLHCYIYVTKLSFKIWCSEIPNHTFILCPYK